MLTFLENPISTGAKVFKLWVIEFFIDKALDKTHIVIKSIKQITVIEKVIVFILLENCLKVKLFKPL